MMPRAVGKQQGFIRAVLLITAVSACSAFCLRPLFPNEKRIDNFRPPDRASLVTRQHSGASWSDRRPVSVAMSSDSDEFWKQQKQLMEDLSSSSEMSLKQEQLEKFKRRQLAFVSDTGFFAILIACLAWGLSDNFFFPISYLLGATFGLAYAYGLGKYVETLGGSVDDAGSGAGVGAARFAFLILLFVFVGKFRSEGLMEIPAILGFFTYQLASLSQGLKEIND